MSIIECVNLTKEYIAGEQVVTAVDHVTVSFEQGEFCAITGPSGSGKSTFLHILSSLENPTSGSVTYGGTKLSDYNDNQLSILRRRRFGFVFQAYNLVNELTGYENILLPIMLDKKKVDQAYLDRILKLTQITNVHTGSNLSYAYAKCGDDSRFGRVSTVEKNVWTDIFIPAPLRLSGSIISLYMASYYSDRDCYISGYWDPY